VKVCSLCKTGILLLLLSLSGLSLAQKVEIISVQHRSAEDIGFTFLVNQLSTPKQYFFRKVGLTKPPSG